MSTTDAISTENRGLQDSLTSQTFSSTPPPLTADVKPPVPTKPNPWHTNVHPLERAASVVAGTALVAQIFRQFTPLRFIGALSGSYLLARGLSGHCSLYSLIDYDAVNQLKPAPPTEYFRSAVHLEHSVTINKPAAELYAFWRQFENLPRFMAGLESVTQLDELTSHWVAKAPVGTVVQWQAEIIAEEQDRLIAWRSLGNADVDNAGSVRFLEAPGNRGTEVRIVIDFVPPFRTVGNLLSKLLGQNPESQIKEDLRRFKQLMETGELPTIQGQPRGSRC